MKPEVTLHYVPRSFSVDPHIRVTVFRESGSAILEIGYAAIEEICEPKSDGREDLLQAFRESVPVLLQILNAIIANIPPGGVVYVTQTMLRSNRIAAAPGRPLLTKFKRSPPISAPGLSSHPTHRTSVGLRSQIKSEKGYLGGGRSATVRGPRDSQ